MAYQVAQEISAQATVLSGRVDAIILTGDCSNEMAFIDMICDRVSWITERILVYPRKDGLTVLADCALRVLQGRERAMTLGNPIAPVHQ
jgi:butyrate kinase